MSSYLLKSKMDSDYFAQELFGKLIGKENPIFLCVGSSRCVGDCLGPIVGELLTKKYNINAMVYGNLDNNITVNNIDNYVSFIKKEHPSSPIIIVDSSVGNEDEVGLVKFSQGGIIPAGYIQERKQILGDFGITSVVNTVGISQLIFLKGTTLKIIWKLGAFIAESVNKFMVKKAEFSF